jgi:hypothetical protein
MPGCLHCGGPIKGKRSDKEYCSDRCRNAAFQARTNRTHIKDGDTIIINGKTFYLYREKRTT